MPTSNAPPKPQSGVDSSTVDKCASASNDSSSSMKSTTNSSPWLKTKSTPCDSVAQKKTPISAPSPHKHNARSSKDTFNSQKKKARPSSAEDKASPATVTSLSPHSSPMCART